MLFVIRFTDKLNSLDTQKQHLEAHISWSKTFPNEQMPI